MTAIAYVGRALHGDSLALIPRILPSVPIGVPIGAQSSGACAPKRSAASA